MPLWTEVALAISGYMLCIVLSAWVIGEFIAWVTDDRKRNK